MGFFSPAPDENYFSCLRSRLLTYASHVHLHECEEEDEHSVPVGIRPALPLDKSETVISDADVERGETHQSFRKHGDFWESKKALFRALISGHRSL